MLTMRYLFLILAMLGVLLIGAYANAATGTLQLSYEVADLDACPRAGGVCQLASPSAGVNSTKKTIASERSTTRERSHPAANAVKGGVRVAGGILHAPRAVLSKAKGVIKLGKILPGHRRRAARHEG
jgi:hypothetical protein